MKKIILITFFLSIGYFSYAQIVFNNVYDNDSLDEFGYAVVETSNGYLIGGSTQSIFTGYVAAYLIRTNNNGDTLWTKEYNLTNDFETILDIIPLSSGGYMLCGFLKDTVTASDAAYLMRINEQGDSLWMQQYKIGPENDWAWSIAQTMDGGFAVAGWTWNTLNPSFSDAWVFKTDSLGNLLWQKQFDNYGREDLFEKIIITPDSGIVCAGTTVLNSVTGKDYVVKLNQQGDTIWIKQFGGIEAGGTWDINLTSDNGFIGCGAIVINGEQKASIYRLDSLGNQLWYKNYARGDRNYGFESACQLTNGNFMAAGADIDSSQPMATGAPRIRLMELNALGDSIWSKQYTYYGNSTEDYLLDMKPTLDGGYIMTGFVISFQAQRNDILLIKVDSNGCVDTTCQLSVGVDASAPLSMSLLVYPNPSNTIVNFELPFNSSSKNAQLFLFNVTGKEVFAKKVVTSTTKINVSNYPKGIYFYQLISEKEKYSGKLIVD